MRVRLEGQPLLHQLNQNSSEMAKQTKMVLALPEGRVQGKEGEEEAVVGEEVVEEVPAEVVEEVPAEVVAEVPVEVVALGPVGVVKEALQRV